MPADFDLKDRMVATKGLDPIAAACADCGTTGGSRGRCRQPRRRSGERFGIDGPLCCACYQTWARAGRGRKRAPGHRVEKAPRPEPGRVATSPATFDPLAALARLPEGDVAGVVWVFRKAIGARHEAFGLHGSTES